MAARQWIVIGLLLAAPLLGRAQAGVPAAAPHNVLQLSATGSVEVQQDVLSITLSTTREAADAATVQNQLKAALDAAVTEARKKAQAGQLDVRTGHFALSPRYGREGRITGWSGTAELVLEGRDIPRIAAVAATLPALVVAQVNFSLSREQRTRAELEAQGLAIQRFKDQALDIARAFGFADYSLREVALNSGEVGLGARPRMMATQAKAVSDAPLPVEAGRTTVSVQVSGSVQMR